MVPIVIFLIGTAACLGIWSSVRYVNRVAVHHTSNTVKSNLLKQFFNPPNEMNNQATSLQDAQGEGFLAVPVDETRTKGKLNERAAPKMFKEEKVSTHVVANTKRGAAIAAAAEIGADPGAHYPQLHCQAYGGPAEDVAQEMVYWQGWSLLVAYFCFPSSGRSWALLSIYCC